MSLTGLTSIDSTIHKTQRWINEVSEGMDLLERERSLSALRATLHAVRDHLPLQAAIGLGAQLPLLVRGMYYESWDPSAKVDRPRTKQEALERIDADLPWAKDVGLEPLVRTVLAVIERHVDPAEVAKVTHLLPRGLKDLWDSAHG